MPSGVEILLRILVLSDSHTRVGRLREICELHSEASAVIFLGDGAYDIESVSENISDKALYAVRGNCDLFCENEDERFIELGGKRILFCHGHAYDVKFTYEKLKSHAACMGADIVLFGHTHIPFKDYEDGMYIMNPGSVYDGRYGMIDITSAGVNLCLCEL